MDHGGSNHTLVWKTYDKKRLQETQDDLPDTEPNSSKIFHSLDYIQTGRSFHAVRWKEKNHRVKAMTASRKTNEVCPTIQAITEMSASDEVTYSFPDITREMKSEPSIMPGSDNRRLS